MIIMRDDFLEITNNPDTNKTPKKDRQHVSIGLKKVKCTLCLAYSAGDDFGMVNSREPFFQCP